MTHSCIAPHGDDRAAHAAEVGYLCRPAYARLEQQLAELPALSSWLRANLASGGSGESDGSKRTKGEPPIPIRENVHDHVVEIRQVLASWSALVAEERDLRGPANADPTTTVPFLLAHLEWAASQPWVDDLLSEVADLSRTGHGMVPSRPQTYRLPLPCITCGVQLSRRDGSDIECEGCGRLWRVDQYQQLIEHAAEQERNRSGWLTPEAVADQLHLNPKTVRSWAKRLVIASVCAVLPGSEPDQRLRVHPDEVRAKTRIEEAS